MIRQNTINTFTGGLVSDLEPLSTPDNVLTDCLNGTISTFNGNSDALQTDMGNAKIGAYLPEGYIPLGSASLDGIIYIVAYDPLTKQCQIGSFPSPQRDYNATDENSNAVELSNTDFKKGSEIKTYFCAKSFKNEVNPGDLFYAYFDNSITTKDFEVLYDKNKDNKGYIKLSLGYLDSNSQVHKLKNISYEVKKPEDIRHLSVDMNSKDAVVPSSSYKVYNTKVAGELLLIAELIKPDNFDISTEHRVVDKVIKENDKDVTKTYYAPKFKWSLYDNDEVFGNEKDYFKVTNIHYVFKIHNDGEENVTAQYDVIQKITNPSYTTELKDQQFQITENDSTAYTLKKWNGEEYTDITDSVQFFDYLLMEKDGKKTKTHIEISIIPELEYGQIELLEKKIYVDLDDVNTGKIDLRKYQYINNYEEIEGVKQNTYQFYLQLDAYPRVGDKITDVNIYLYSHNAITKDEDGNFSFNATEKYLLKQISIGKNLDSYHGTFTTATIEYDSDIEQENYYIAQIISTVEKEDKTIKNKVLGTRFFFTDNYWNDKYKVENVDDFKDLSYDPEPVITYESVYRNLNSIDAQRYGELQSDIPENVEDLSSVINVKSYFCHADDYSMDVSVKASYKYRDDLYMAQYDSISANTDDISTSYHSNQSMDGQSEMTDEEKVFFNQTPIKVTNDSQFPNWDANAATQYKVKYDIKSPYYVKANVEVAENNKFTINYKDNKFERIYTKKELKDCSYSGKIIPLAYNDATFAAYGLQMEQYYKYKTKTIISATSGNEIIKYISHTDFIVNKDESNKYSIKVDNNNTYYTKDYDTNFQLRPSELTEDGQLAETQQLIKVNEKNTDLYKCYFVICSRDNSDIKGSGYVFGQLIKVDEVLYFNVLNPKEDFSISGNTINLSVYNSLNKWSLESEIELITDSQGNQLSIFAPKYLGVYNMGNKDGISIGSISSDNYTLDTTGISSTEMNRRNFHFANESAMSDNTHIAGWNNNLLFAIYDGDSNTTDLKSEDKSIVSSPIRTCDNLTKQVAVILFVKYNDTFIPIKFVTHVQNVKSYEKRTWLGVYDQIMYRLNNNIEWVKDEKGNLVLDINGQAQVSKVEENKNNIFFVLGSILNNLYRYDNNVVYVQKYIPKQNTWDSGAKYKTIVPISISYKMIPKKIENIEYNDSDPQNSKNIDHEYEIVYNEDNIIMQRMLDYITSQSDTNLKTAVYDRDGSTILQGVADTNLQTDRIYFSSKGTILRESPEIFRANFSLNKETGGLNIIYEQNPESLGKISSDINTNFQIQDGILTLRSPNYNGRTFKAKAGISSYQNFSLLENKYNKYECPE